MLSPSLLVLGNLVALLVIVYALFVPRFSRHDTAVALVILNLSVLATSLLLTRSQAAVGLGLGLFGLLSVVRLRSDEMSHDEMAYFLACLILGLVGGVDVDPAWLSPALMVLLVGALWGAGHPRLTRGRTERTIVLDRAVIAEAEIRAILTDLLGDLVDGRHVMGVRVRRVDLINDSTVVQVRYRLSESSPARSAVDLELGERNHDVVPSESSPAGGRIGAVVSGNGGPLYSGSARPE